MLDLNKISIIDEEPSRKGPKTRVNGNGLPEEEPFLLVASRPKAEDEIPPRSWLFGHYLLRGYASATIAPGGVGKSALALTEALSMATGQRLLHYGPRKPLRVWLWNLEDPLEELERRVAAIAKRFKISPEEVGDRLFLTSGRDLPLKIAKISRGGFEVDKALVAKVILTLRERQIDVLKIDPLVSSHYVSENDNMAMDAVGQNRELEANDARGASAIIDAVRSSRLLQKMTEDEAREVEIRGRWRYFRAVDGKVNLAPPAETSSWFKLESVELLNGDVDYGNDSVGVVVPWSYPTLTEALASDIIGRVQAKVREGEYRADYRASNWVGYAVGPLCRLDPDDDSQRKKIRKLIRAWVGSGALREVERQDKNRHRRTFVEAG